MTPIPAPHGTRAGAQIGPALLLAALWLLNHPYQGLVHDSQLYTAQALYRQHPDIFGRDLFFAFGSQARFTAFPDLHAAAIRLLGLEHASMGLVALAQAAWVAGAALLVRRLTGPGAGFWLALALVVAMPAGYGGLGVLAYGEGFATPRPLVEAATLVGLAVLLAGRTGMALGLLLASAVLHPLMALPGLAAAGVYLALRDTRWLLPPLAGLALALVLALGGVAPFAGLLQTMDGDWLDLVATRNRYVFPSEWSSGDWNVLVFDAAVTAAAAGLSGGRRRRLFAAVLAAGVGGVAISAAGGDLLHNVSIIQAQPWRAAWLLHIVAYIALATLVARSWRYGANAGPVVAALAAAWFLLPLPVGGLLGGVAAALALADGRGHLPSLSQPTHRVFCAFAVLAGLVWAGLNLWRVYILWRLGAPSGLGEGPLSLLGPPFGIQCAGLVLFAVWLLRGGPPESTTRAATAFALAAVVAAGALWDRRTDWARLFDSAPPALAHFAELMPGDAQVYWEGDPRPTWLLLRRASYVSRIQGAGILFSRETAIAFRNRMGHIRPLGTRDRLVPFGSLPPRSTPGAAPPDAAALAAACGRARELDFIVLATPVVAGRVLAVWHAPAPDVAYELVDGRIEARVHRDYYLYACRDLRG